MSRGALVGALILRGVGCWIAGALAAGLCLASLMIVDGDVPARTVLFGFMLAAGFGGIATLPLVALLALIAAAAPRTLAARPISSAGLVAALGVALGAWRRGPDMLPMIAGFAAAAIVYIYLCRVRPLDLGSART